MSDSNFLKRIQRQARSTRLATALSLLFILAIATAVEGAYPVVRPPRKKPAPESGKYTIHVDRPQQTVWGLGFEIQCDSIGSGNNGHPESHTSVPHDLTMPERHRLAEEMLSGFRYCRLAGGLYWRGTEKEGKYLRPRWENQLSELHDLLEWSGVESLSFEYWSPPPYWKANRGYTKADGEENILRCYGKQFSNDPHYRGNVQQFLKDYSAACVKDIKTLKQAGFKIDQWGLSNEPWTNTNYASCKFTKEEYGEVFKAVAPAIRQHDPNIKIIADSMWGSPRYIAPVMRTEYAKYVDALVVHAIGDDSENVVNNLRETRKIIRQELPLFQNEYEYLQGPASRDRCHNTVQNIMNWFQLAESPTWYWIHALKPYQNAEASGYSLGFWRPVDLGYTLAQFPPAKNVAGPRTAKQYALSKVPEELIGTYSVTVERGDMNRPGRGYQFEIDNRCEAFLLVHERGNPELPETWKATDMRVVWGGKYTDRVYRRVVEPGVINVPAHNGRNENGHYGIPHSVLLRDISGSPVVVEVTGLSKTARLDEVRMQTQEDPFEDLQPGHWTWNRYNWHSVVGFLKHMPWDSTVLEVSESVLDHDMRILAFKRPDGKLVIVLSNRCWKDFTFDIDTGLEDATFRGVRYSPDEPGEKFMGVPVGELTGPRISPSVPDLCWEFWIQQ